ncbi:hypothetical protein V1582_11315 [Enterobacter hormaechei subsp. xiangfangensis]|uniref:hypothetical protein n=1 Tax=Enterobacter hormaechei TaxID=158836 RepID=UPI003754D4F8
MTANKPMTGEQLDELMTIAVNMQRDSEKVSGRPAAMFAYAVQVAVLELRKVRNEAAALAAELRAVEAMHNEAVFITDDHYEQCPPGVQKIIRSLAVMQIHAYKSFLAEVLAQGVEMFAASLKVAGGHEHPYSSVANEFAAQIRKGVQQ